MEINIKTYVFLVARSVPEYLAHGSNVMIHTFTPTVTINMMTGIYVYVVYNTEVNIPEKNAFADILNLPPYGKMSSHFRMRCELCRSLFYAVGS